MEYDEFGFLLPEENRLPARQDSSQHLPWQPRVLRPLIRRYRGWDDYRRQRNDPSFVFDSFSLKWLIRTGIPNDLRADVWSQCLGSRDLMDRFPSYYAQYVDQAEEATPSQTLQLIDLDISRTFPTHRIYQTDEGRQRLRRVLRAFAVYNPSIGYCQALNFLAGLLLIYMDEDLSFWSLVLQQSKDVQLVSSCKTPAGQRMDVADYYTEGLLGLKRDLNVRLEMALISKNVALCSQALQFLMKRYASRTLAVLKAENIELGWICSEWFLCFFSTSLPIKTTLRVWDTLMHEGQKVFFRVSLALFKHFELHLPKPLSLETILYYFKKGLKADIASPDRLIYTAFYRLGTLKRADIYRLQRQAAAEVLEAYRAEEQRKRQRKGFRDVKQTFESETFKKSTEYRHSAAQLSCVDALHRPYATSTIPQDFRCLFGSASGYYRTCIYSTVKQHEPDARHVINSVSTDGDVINKIFNSPDDTAASPISLPVSARENANPDSAYVCDKQRKMTQAFDLEYHVNAFAERSQSANCSFELFTGEHPVVSTTKASLSNSMPPSPERDTSLCSIDHPFFSQSSRSESIQQDESYWSKYIPSGCLFCR